MRASSVKELLGGAKSVEMVWRDYPTEAEIGLICEWISRYLYGNGYEHKPSKSRIVDGIMYARRNGAWPEDVKLVLEGDYRLLDELTTRIWMKHGKPEKRKPKVTLQNEAGF